MKFKLTLIILPTLMLAACSDDLWFELTNWHKYSSPHNTKSGTSLAMAALREQVLKETALSLGARGGLAWRADQINRMLKKNRKTLDRVFDFNQLILNHNVVPPVLMVGDESLHLASPNAIRLADKIYKIERQAHFVTTPPNWRRYLWLEFTKPGPPNLTLLPKTKKEKREWRKNVAIGWKKGINQANTIFAVNLARLKRDYKGMLLYRTLLTQHMVSAPFVARTNLGVTGDANKLRINDQVLRITALPELQTNSKRWQPILVKKHE